MKNYFSWKRLGLSVFLSNRNEQPLLQVVDPGPQPSSCATTLLKHANLMAAQHGTTTDMMVRTIAVCTPEQETVNAALLCSFAVPAAEMNYLAYSLNESMGDEDVRVYIAALQCELGRYSLATSIDDYAWLQAFWQIFGQRQGSQEATWHYIDIGQQPLPIAPCGQHVSVNIKRALVRGLLFRLSAGETGQAIEYAPIASTCCNELVNNTPDARQDLSALAWFIDQGDEQDEQLDEIQASLSSVVVMAQELEQRHSVSTQQHQRLEEMHNQLLEKERELNGKAKELASRYAALLDAEGQETNLQTRLKLLDEREAALKARSQELALAHQRLSANRARFSTIVKKFHVAVQLKGVFPQHLNEVAEQQAAG